MDLEDKVKSKESQFGGTFNKDNLKQVLGDIKSKNIKFKQLSSILKDIKSEHSVLMNTELILQRKLEESRENLHNLEVEKNCVGLSKYGKDIEKVSKIKNEIDKDKEELMEELSKDVEIITRTCAEKKKEIEPAIQERKVLNEDISKLEKVYNKKKAD